MAEEGEAEGDKEREWRRKVEGSWSGSCVSSVKVHRSCVRGAGRGAGFAGNEQHHGLGALLSLALPAMSPICLMLHSSSLTSNKVRLLAHGQRRQHDM